MRQLPPVRVLLISTYDMGRQPFGLASPAAWLRQADHDVTCVDLAKEKATDEVVRRAELIAFFLPMHTATRLALPVMARVRALNPSAKLCAYGLYAPLNAEQLRAAGVDVILGGEFEADLCDAAAGLTPVSAPALEASRPVVARLQFRTPDRTGLPPLARYARLAVPDGSRRIVGYTEASRGCKHRCTHCPVVPIYDGRFRIVPVDVVLADVRAQVAAGAEHITFGDPDFFNGIGHALKVAAGVAHEFPGLTYDVTIKVQHLLEHQRDLRRLRDTGCLFVTSAVESIDDRVLARLEKNHTRRDFERAVAIMRDVELHLAPTFVAFTPWITRDGYRELLSSIDALGLVDHVAPIQWAIRLLITHDSRLLEGADVRDLVEGFDPSTLVHRWRHPDPWMDALQDRVQTLVGVNLGASRREVFEKVWAAAHDAPDAPADAAALLPRGRDATDGAPNRSTVPYLTEPWYC